MFKIMMEVAKTYSNNVKCRGGAEQSFGKTNDKMTEGYHAIRFSLYKH